MRTLSSFCSSKEKLSVAFCRVAKNLPVLELLNHFIKSSTDAYKRVAYKKNLVYCSSIFMFPHRSWSFLTFSSNTFFENLIMKDAVVKNFTILRIVLKFWFEILREPQFQLTWLMTSVVYTSEIFYLQNMSYFIMLERKFYADYCLQKKINETLNHTLKTNGFWGAALQISADDVYFSWQIL